MGFPSLNISAPTVPSLNLNQNYGKGFHDAFFSGLDQLTGAEAARENARKKADKEKRQAREKAEENRTKADTLLAGQRLSLLQQSGYSSTILSPGLGTQSVLGG